MGFIPVVLLVGFLAAATLPFAFGKAFPTPIRGAVVTGAVAFLVRPLGNGFLDLLTIEAISGSPHPSNDLVSAGLGFVAPDESSASKNFSSSRSPQASGSLFSLSSSPRKLERAGVMGEGAFLCVEPEAVLAPTDRPGRACGAVIGAEAGRGSLPSALGEAALSISPLVALSFFVKLLIAQPAQEDSSVWGVPMRGAAAPESVTVGLGTAVSG